MSTGIIMVVDDQPLMLKLVEAILTDEPYEVIALTDAGRAVDLAVEQGERIRLLITDVRMARMSGGELADAVRNHVPNIRVLFMSGASADDAGLEMGTGRDFIAKPFSPAELRQRVKALLGD